MSDWKWTTQREKAALLVAEDELSDERIASSVGVTRATLAAWKGTPEFTARVKEHVAAFAVIIRNSGIGRLENRVARLDRDWRKLKLIETERAVRAREEKQLIDSVRETLLEKMRQDGASDLEIAQEVLKYEGPEAGIETGLIVRKETPTKFGTIIEYVVDTGTLAELRAMEMQAAKELGQIVDRAESREYDMRDFNDSEIDRLADGEPIERVFADSRRRRAREAPAGTGEGEQPGPPPVAA